MGRFLDRAMEAIWGGDVNAVIRREADRVAAEARQMTPLNRSIAVNGYLTQETTRSIIAEEYDLQESVAIGVPVERYLMRNAAGEPVIKERVIPHPHGGVLHVPVSIDPDIIQDKWEEQTAFGSMLADLARRQSRMTEGEALAADHIRRFHHCGGYHEEPVTTFGGIVVSWICRNCSYVRYSVAWIVNGENEEE